MSRPPEFDLIVIGGGVNGTGIARDAAMRGLKVLLLEKKDFASGASGANSGMIHGGIRYLRYQRKTTELAAIDSGYIQRIVPHLLFRIPFLYPLTAKDTRRPTLHERYLAYGAEVYFGAYDRYQPLKRGLPSVHLTAEEAVRLEPALRQDNLLGAMSLDEWGIDPWRLCALNALSAQQHGALLKTYTQVTGFLRGAQAEVQGVEARDVLTGSRGQYRSKLVVNAGGAWAPKLGALAGVSVKMRPGKGVHLVLDRRFSNYGVITHAVDGRQMFVMPHEANSVIGTTDDDFYGDPDSLAATEDEVKYLLEGAQHALPGIGKARVVRTWVGLRTTLYEYGKPEDDLSREHAIYDHAAEGAKNLFTLLGGKLASYRVQSEEFTNLACRLLGNDSPCRTHLEPLPGGEGFPDTADLAAQVKMPEPVVGRMAYRHGKNAIKICELVSREPSFRALLCPCEQVSYAEAVFCLREENVRTLSDLARRCRVGLGPCDGAGCAGAAAALFARERKLSVGQAQAELRKFLEERFAAKRPVLDGEQLAQEELSRGQYFTVGQLDRSRRG